MAFAPRRSIDLRSPLHSPLQQKRIAVTNFACFQICINFNFLGGTIIGVATAAPDAPLPTPLMFEFFVAYHCRDLTQTHT